MIIIDTFDKYKRLQRKLHKAIAHELGQEVSVGMCKVILEKLEKQQGDFGLPIIVSDEDYNELHIVECSYER